jgi:hypothetical protein
MNELKPYLFLKVLKVKMQAKQSMHLLQIMMIISCGTINSNRSQSFKFDLFYSSSTKKEQVGEQAFFYF